MSSVKERAFEQAIKTLTALNCQFAVITPDGVRHGTLEIAAAKTRTYVYPRGTFLNYVKPIIEHVKVGDVVSVPGGEFSLDQLQGAVCNIASNLWGRGNYTTSKVDDAVELLRLA